MWGSEGWIMVASMFLSTIVVTVLLDHTLHLPPFFGMMLGLGALNLYSYFLHRHESKVFAEVFRIRPRTTNLRKDPSTGSRSASLTFSGWSSGTRFFSSMGSCSAWEAWELSDISMAYRMSSIQGWGRATANILIGLLSAIIDNIPLTYAVLTMMPKWIWANGFSLHSPLALAALFYPLDLRQA